ncbi:MAG: glycosyltransferase family 4 protein [Candidatus Eremiobacteraeota bacterium]|nr:glycosyltransferase family 4 protein [Candidatus Eremiobacteraeota bacterium]MBC5826513.1 glycosyltransferase family 4 protein [Candidatus Eremiobacteraeota bacterium]
MLRLGVDAANIVRDRRGIGRYARALLRNWMSRPDRIDITLLVPDLFPQLLVGRIAAVLGARNFRVARRTQTPALDIDVVWYPWNGMTWIAPGPKVATMHDVWPFASPSPDARIRRHEQEPFRATAAHAGRIITDSEFSKSEIAFHLGVQRETVDVVYLGVDPPIDVPPARFGAAARYVLFVGEAESRKDLATLVEAMDRLPGPMRKDTALVVAGKGFRTEIEPVARRFSIIAAGEVDDMRLAALYAGACAFVLPSRYEGFGLPVLEAMSYGVPVIASDATALPEAGGDAACYFAAGDAAALSQVLARLIEDPVQAGRSSSAGRRRAAEMTWARCADATLAIIERAARSANI